MSASAPEASIQVRVTPRSSRTEISGYQSGVLAVRLHAPPVEGEANKALIKLLSRFFHLPQRQVEIVRGDASRTKTIHLTGISQDEARSALERLADSGN